MTESTLPHGRPLPPAIPNTPPMAGTYRLERRLGVGGMGEVWLAEQPPPLRRTVAVKLIRAGMDSAQVIARFETERQALALMEHPAIARVFDGGSTSDGRPYFVMEYVPGEPLPEYCDGLRLAVRERLELFVQVCEGVEHAHRKAILHRDLKPANILVSTADGKPSPKIIDFGIAKALAQPQDGRGLSTEVGALLGTPEYMSPEQADPSCSDIDTRADVYSLGVILYELLCGSLPFASRTLRAAGLGELQRLLQEARLPPPSARLATERVASEISARRRATPEALARALRGDLDAIAMKALEKDRERRYGSAADLASDIGRFLRREPVLAQAPSAAYRLGKLVARHRAAAAAIAAAALVLPAFTVTLAIEVRRVARERDRASREEEASRRVADFMAGMFSVADPSEARGNSITAREVLDRASADIGTALAKDPELQARMMDTMGGVYASLGLYSKAHALLEAALVQRRRVLGADAPETLASMRALGGVLRQEGRTAEAIRLVGDALALQRRVLGSGQAETARSMFELGAAMQGAGQPAPAEALLREALGAQRATLGPEHPSTLRTLNGLANVVSADPARAAEAELLFRQALQLDERAFGTDAPQTLQVLGNLAGFLADRGRNVEGELLTRQVIEREARVLGPEHQVTLIARHNLGTILLRLGRPAEAERVLQEVLQGRTRTLGPEHPDTLEAMQLLAMIRKHQGRYPEADALLRETLDLRRRILGPRHPDTLETEYNLACNLAQSHRAEEAIGVLRDALERGLPAGLAAQIATDDDFKPLRGDPRFEALAAASSTPPAP